MICFDIELNGERVVTAGLPGWSVVTTVIGWVRSQNREPTPGSDHFEELSLDVSGLDSNAPEGLHVSWVRDHALKIGDEIRVRVVDRDIASAYEPKETSRSSPAEQAVQLRTQIARLTEALARVEGA